MSDSADIQTVKPAGTSAAQAKAIQGVDGGVPVAVTGTFSASTSAKATAAAPTYVEGTDSPISQDLSGNLRTLASVSATTTAKATAADPSYSEGADSPISQDRSGHLRTTALTDTQLRASAVPVSAAALPLPTGASTEATLALIKAKTDNIDVALSTRTKPADTQTVSGTVAVSNFPATQPISAAVLPLPAGASTSALQSTGNASLASIDGKLTNPLPVSGTVTANQGTAAAGSGAWPVELTEDTTNTVVKPGDATNKAVRVNMVASANATVFYPSATSLGTGTSTDGGLTGTTAFTLPRTPVDTSLCWIYVGGILMKLGVHYTIAGVTVTFIAPAIPQSGDDVWAIVIWQSAPASLWSTLIVDALGNVQPTGDSSARSIHVTLDAATSLPLPSGAATAAGISTLTDSIQLEQRLLYAQLSQQRAALQLQAAIAGQALFLPEVPAFLGVA